MTDIFCKVENCNSPVHRKLMCSLHYQRNKKHGNTSFIWKQKIIDIGVRLFSKIDSENPDSCWLWSGSTVDGYGQIFVKKGKTALVHRISYAIYIGPIPNTFNGKKAFICHTCDNSCASIQGICF